jgi:hypothetical protein
MIFWSPVATVLDVRYKSLNFIQDENEKKRIFTLLENEMTLFINKSNVQTEIQQDPIQVDEDAVFTGSDYTDFISHGCEFVLLDQSGEFNQHENAELKRYLDHKVQVKKKEDLWSLTPLKWWSDNKRDFPRLYKMAMLYAGTPPSSVSSERNFSQTGRLITKIRNRLKPETVSELNFLKSNNDLW